MGSDISAGKKSLLKFKILIPLLQNLCITATIHFWQQQERKINFSNTGYKKLVGFLLLVLIIFKQSSHGKNVKK